MPKTVHPLNTMHQGRDYIPIHIVEVEEVNILLGIIHGNLEAFSESVFVQP